MPIILYPTKAGMDRENLALANGTAMPKISKLVVGDGTPLADPTLATEIGSPMRRIRSNRSCSTQPDRDGNSRWAGQEWVLYHQGNRH